MSPDLHTDRYWPGAATAVRGGDLVALVDTAPGEGLAMGVLEIVERAGSVDEIVHAIMSAGFASAPSFALAHKGHDGWRFVVRGDARIGVAAASGDETIVGQGFFHDTTRGGVDTVHLDLGSVPMAGPGIPLPVGMVPAHHVTLGSVGAPQGSMPVVVEPVVVEPDGVEPDGVAEEVTSWAAEDDFALYDRVASPASRPEVSPELERFMPPAFDPVEVSSPPVAPLVPPLPDLVDELPAGVEPPPTTTAPGFIDTFDFGVPSAPSAPPIAPVPPVAPIAPAPFAAEPVIVVPPHPQPQPQPAPAPQAALAPSPDLTPEPALAAQPVPAAYPTDGADRTVSRAETARQAALAAAAAGGQTVHAARCPNGHLTMAFQPQCRVCRAEVPPQQPIEVPRPILGRLAFPVGDAVPLDRDVIIGRSPRVPEDHGGPTPHLHKVVDPRSEVSSQHAMVTLDYWHVMVTDLGSTNGTEVVLADGRRERLVPHESKLLEPGTTLVLAEIMDVRFEAGE